MFQYILNSILKVTDDSSDSMGWPWLVQLQQESPAEIIKEVQEVSSPQT